MTYTYNSNAQAIVAHKHKSLQLDKEHSLNNLTKKDSIVQNVYKLERLFGVLELFKEYTLAAPIIRA